VVLVRFAHPAAAVHRTSARMQEPTVLTEVKFLSRRNCALSVPDRPRGPPAGRSDASKKTIADMSQQASHSAFESIIEGGSSSHIS